MALMLPASRLDEARARIAHALTSKAAQQQRASGATQTLAPLRLRQFVRDFWPVLEPGTPISWNWHMDHICDHLEAITYGVLGRFADFPHDADKPALTPATYAAIRDLVINVPPRSTKSIIISVMWPAWAWAEVDPVLRWLFSSYSLDLSLDHSRLCRDVIKSEPYQQRYGSRYQLRDDHDTASDFANALGGRRQAVSVGSATTGKGGDILVADDPHNVIEGESEADRKKVKRWYGQAFSTRRNDPATGARVVVMQRIHQDDLSGNLLDAKDSRWERLIYRQEYEPEKDAEGGIAPKRTTALGYADARSTAGELLWPERFTPAVVADAKVTLGDYGYAGQHQQRPAPLAGGIFHREWWQRYSLAQGRAIQFRRFGIFVDTAQKTQASNDYSVFLFAGIDALQDYYLLDLWRAKVEAPELLIAAYDFWLKCTKRVGNALPLLIEDKGSGTGLIQTLRRGDVGRDPGVKEYSRQLALLRPKIPALPFHGDGRSNQSHELKRWMSFDKITRAQHASPIVQAGRVWIPLEAEWASDFISECADFPNGLHDDQVDTLAMAIKWLGYASDKVIRGSN